MAFLCTLKRNMTEMWYFHISNVNLIYNCGSVVMTQVSTWVCNTQISLLTQAGNATQVSSRMCQRKLNVYHIDIFLALDTSSCTSACVRSELDLRAAFELRKNQPDMRIESNSNDSGWHPSFCPTLEFHSSHKRGVRRRKRPQGFWCAD
jgi:hypothetical protein